MGYIEELRQLVGARPIIQVGAGVYVLDKQNRVLLQQRNDNRAWGAPGGAMELGESFEQTARREFREEMGLEVGELQLLQVFSGAELYHIYPSGNEVYFVSARFVCRETMGEIRPDPMEVIGYTFFELDHLPQSLMVADRIGLPLLGAKLQRGEL